MNEQNSTPSAKLISHVLLDFSSEAEMELFINYVEKTKHPNKTPEMDDAILVFEKWLLDYKISKDNAN